MLVTLIPLVLAASINVNETDWKYGPEVIYDTKIDGLSPPLDVLLRPLDGLSPPIDGTTRTITFNTTAKLACRLKSKLILSCILHKIRTVLTLSITWNQSLISLSRKEYPAELPDATPFEIDFDPKNERPIVTTATLESTKINIVRALLAQLIGITNLWTEPGTDTVIANNTIAGQCKVKYVKSTSKAIEEDSSKIANRERASMIMLPDGKPLEREVREMQRITDYHYRNCPKVRIGGSRGYVRELLSSESHTIVTESNFTSYTDYKVAFINDSNYIDSLFDPSFKFVTGERITVTLDKVVPAKGPLPMIPDPIKCVLQDFSVFYSDSTTARFATILYDDWLTLIDDEGEHSLS